VSEYTNQGQQQGTTNQGAPSQGQTPIFQDLQREQGAAPLTPDENWQQGREHDYQYPARGEQPRTTGGEYVRADEVDRIIAEKLAERDRQHAKETEQLRSLVPQLVVPMHAGGPGNDNHRPSWNLAEQEAASRGEHLDHWDDE
jgi:hypothetical protein